MAFLVCSGFCVYGVMQRHLYSVPHYLTGRYATKLNFNLSSIAFSLAIRFLVSANQYFRLKFFNHSNRKTCQSSRSCLIENRIWSWKVRRVQSVERASLRKPVFADISAR